MSVMLELGKILRSVRAYDPQWVGVSFVRTDYERTHYSEQTSSFDDILYAAECLGLLKAEGGKAYLTHIGRKFVDMMTVADGDVILDGNDMQRRLLIRCLDTQCMVDACGDIFGRFSINYSSEPPTWNSYMHGFDDRARLILAILEETGVVSRQNNLAVIRDRHLRLFSALKNRVLGIHVDWNRLHERKKHVGDHGEHVSMEYEILRLTRDGREDLADMVEHVSLTDPYAGYDMMSFDGSGTGEAHDRFIEVKATTGTRPAFFWSGSEVERARQYGNTYWIYLWTDVEDEGSRRLHTIQNPYRELFMTGDPVPEPADYRIDEKVLDHAHVTLGERF